jgi:hypothetical protein
VRLELTNTGFAIRRLGRLATRAENLPRINADKKHSKDTFSLVSDPCLSACICSRLSIGTEGEIRTLESSLEDSHVSSYITSASGSLESRLQAELVLEASRLKVELQTLVGGVRFG